MRFSQTIKTLFDNYVNSDFCLQKILKNFFAAKVNRLFISQTISIFLFSFYQIHLLIQEMLVFGDVPAFFCLLFCHCNSSTNDLPNNKSTSKEHFDFKISHFDRAFWKVEGRCQFASSRPRHVVLAQKLLLKSTQLFSSKGRSVSLDVGVFR